MHESECFTGMAKWKCTLLYGTAIDDIVKSEHGFHLGTFKSKSIGLMVLLRFFMGVKWLVVASRIE